MNDTYELIRLAKQDNEVKRELIEKNMGLVYSVVKRFRQNQAYEDLIQVGCIGLIKAINNFDFNYGVTFSTYAMPIILGEIKRYFRDEGQMKVSRSIKENALKLNKIKENLIQKYEREPTHEELKEASGLDMMEVILALESYQYCASLDSNINQEDDNSMRLDEKIESNQKDVLLYMALEKEINRLEPREQLLIYYRYKKEYNQTEIAKRLNCSQVQVSRLENKIYRKLKEKLVDESLD